jgi:phage shock protein C
VTDRLYRSQSDRMIAGVAGGLATWLAIDPSLVRVAWVLLAIFTGGAFLLVYFVMMIVVPQAPDGWVPRPRNAGTWTPPPGANPGSGWAPGGGPESAVGPGLGPTPGSDPSGSTGWNTPPPAWPTPPPDWSTSRAAGNAGLVTGGALVLLGAWFLLDDYVHIDPNLVWPVVVIVLGVLLIAGAVRRGR